MFYISLILYCKKTVHGPDEGVLSPIDPYNMTRKEILQLKVTNACHSWRSCSWNPCKWGNK